MIGALLGGAFVGGLINAGTKLISSAGENEEKKRKGQLLQDMARKIEDLKKDSQGNFETITKYMADTTNNMKADTRKMIWDNVNAEISVGSKAIQNQLEQVSNSLKKRGDEYSKFIANQVKDYGKQIATLGGEAARSLSQERMRHKIGDVVGKLSEQEKKYRTDMETKNKEFQANVVEQLTNAGNQSAFAQQQMMESLVGKAAAAAAQADVQYGQNQTQAYFNAFQNNAANIQNFTEQQIKGTLMGDYLKNSQIDWGQIAGAGLQGLTPALTTIGAGLGGVMSAPGSAEWEAGINMFGGNTKDALNQIYNPQKRQFGPLTEAQANAQATRSAAEQRMTQRQNYNYNNPLAGSLSGQ